MQAPKRKYLKATFEPKVDDMNDRGFAKLLSDVLLRLNIATFDPPDEYQGGRFEIEPALHYRCCRSDEEIRLELEKLCSIYNYSMTLFNIIEKEVPLENPA